jgi:hypothetical protein
VRAEDAFALLGLPITATEAEIKSAYRRLVAQYHPDRHPQSAEWAATKLRAINDAYAFARAGWATPRAGGPIYAPPKPPPRPPRGTDRPIYAPPKPPPKPVGPQVPPPHVDSPRAQAYTAAAAMAARRDAVVLGLVEAGFLDPEVDTRRGHPVVDAFLPLVEARDRLRSCDRYASLHLTGTPELQRREHAFLHAVPSLGVGSAAARSEAIARIEPAQVVACTDDHLLWSTSTFGSDDGPFLREEIEAFAVPLRSVERARRTVGAVELGLTGGAVIVVELEADAAARLLARIAR